MRTIPLVTVALLLTVTACDGDDGTSTPSPSSTSSTSSSGGAAGPKVVGGVTIPTTIKLCSQSLTAVSSSTTAGFTWSAVPNATRYAVLANKAPTGATTLTEVFSGTVDGTARGGSYTFPERVSGTSYTIEVYALAGSEPLCQLDGVNGITAS